nr:sugar transferase [Planosporangium flavigriseum]
MLLLGSFALALMLAWNPGSSNGWKPSARACRRAFLTSAALTSSVWCWLYVNHWAPPYGALLAVVGGLAGAMIAAALDNGLVENNAAPSVGVREKVLAHHVTGDLHYPRQPRFKRAFDVVGALVALVVTLPLWIVIAVLVWLAEPGPIFFIKNSVGRGGITFRQVKFRSMKYGAERSTGPVASPANDPRTLTVGRFLRRWHLDELPELINVLRGTMSLVGPRPLRTVLVQKHLEEVPGYAERHTVKPGIACTAQIEKYHIAPAERLDKDREYIASMSVALDLRLLGRAVRTTLRGERHHGEPADAVRWLPPGRPNPSRSPSTGSPRYRRGSVPPDLKDRSTRPGTRPRSGRGRSPVPSNPASPASNEPSSALRIRYRE